MFAYVARQPILDKDRNVYGYELLFRDGKRNCYPEVEPDEASSRILAANCLTLGLEDLACNKTSFINFHHDSILNNFPASLDPKSVVVELVDSVPGTQQMVEACQHIRKQGYRVALDEHDFDQRFMTFLPALDILKVDLQKAEIDIFEKQIPRLKENNVLMVAEKVETHEDFNLCRQLGFDYFQGYFFAKPEVIKQKNMTTSKMIMFELLQESAGESFDLDKLTSIFEKDAGLAYMLLRFINNPTINKRQQITSLRHAVTYMGHMELKKFVALLAIANLGEEKPTELLHLSLVRAKFCDLLAKARGNNGDTTKGFMVGLLSLLDAILDQSMEDVLRKLPILDEVKQALCGVNGELKNYIAMVRSLESATWMKVIQLAKTLEMDQREIHSLFNQAIVWGNEIRSALSPHYPTAKPSGANH